MNIGLIRTRYTPYGGAEVFLSRFLSELLKRGHSLEVFAKSWEQRPGVNVHKIKTFGPSFLKPLVFALKVRSCVARVRPDIVISLERTLAQEIYRAGDGCHREWLERRAKVSSPVKRLMLKLNPLHRVLLFLEKRLFTSKDLKYVVANSRRGKAEIINHYGLPEEKICVIYNGVDLRAFDYEDREGLRDRLRKELGVGDDTVLFLFVGSGFERKGLIYLIRALPILQEKLKGIEFKLLVIGKGRTGRYIREAERLGVGERVSFMGPRVDANQYYPAGDLFVLPSIYEPFSNACLEAMAASLPVITSEVNGASEIITDNVNGGVLKDPADPEGLAQKIIPFLDRGKRLEAGRLAREEALKHPIEGNVDEFIALVGEVMDEKAT